MNLCSMFYKNLEQILRNIIQSETGYWWKKTMLSTKKNSCYAIVPRNLLIIVYMAHAVTVCPLSLCHSAA